ncbi:MAG: hypothetical protein GY833_23860, partial [Aestuariibacter sp.]|nr:hypothetical protein [Aestuariibacter sp.]
RVALAGGTDLPDRCVGAALFADISGFTPLTRAFAEALGSKRGAEALLGVLNPLFDALISPAHRYGGSVIGFAGDAFTCWFDDADGIQDAEGIPDGDGIRASSRRAVAAALAMQAAMTEFAEVQTPAGTAITLSVKVALAAGPARRFLVGDPAIQQMDALAGATLARMAATEKHAERGQVVVSQEIVESLGSALRVETW